MVQQQTLMVSKGLAKKKRKALKVFQTTVPLRLWRGNLSVMIVITMMMMMPGNNECLLFVRLYIVVCMYVIVVMRKEGGGIFLSLSPFPTNFHGISRKVLIMSLSLWTNVLSGSALVDCARYSS